MKKFFGWIDDRTGIGAILHEALFERVPGGARWRYVWGSTLTFAIMVQFITGIFLWMAYSPSATTAWESVYYIQHEMRFGWLLRGIHHWTAQVMVVLLVLHLVQVVIDCAYRAPREFNFWFGLGLLGLTLAISLTGYLLPWDQKGFWATKVATNLAGVTPVIGDDLQRVIVGGTDYGHHTLTRFFALHAGVLPGALVLLIVVHIYLFRRHGITEARPATRAGALYYWSAGAVIAGTLTAIAFLLRWGGTSDRWVPWVIAAVFVAVLVRIGFLVKYGKDDDSARRPRRDGMFWPDQILRDAIACLAVLGAVLFFVFWMGTHLTPPADPSRPYDAARPDWYFMSLFRMLKFDFFAGEFGLILGAFIVPGILAAVVFLMPLLGKSKVGHCFNVVALYLLIGGFVALTAMAFSHDAGDESYRAGVEAAHAEADRVKELIAINGGIPPEGALALLAADPKSQGPRLFAQNCASCHPYGGHDGSGKEMADKPSAPDLKGVGSREWIARLLTLEDYQGPHYFGNTKFAEGSMAEALEDLELSEEDIGGLAAALSSEAGLRSQVAADARDAELIAKGFAWMGEDELACVDCHKVRGEGGTKGPDLTGYMSRQWMVDFIGNPAHERFYGDKNDRMPNFLDVMGEDGGTTAGKLDLRRVGLIVDWMRGEWVQEAEAP